MVNVRTSFFTVRIPGLEQERINVPFRWIWQHTASCPLRTGVVCCLPTCAQGSSAAVTRIVVHGAFWAFWVLLGVLCMWEALALPVCSLIRTGLGSRMCAYRWTRPLGGGRPLGVLWLLHQSAWKFRNRSSYYVGVMLYMLALVKLPSLHGYCACMVCWIKEAPRRDCRQSSCETFFSPIGVFLFNRNSSYRFLGRCSGIFQSVWLGILTRPPDIWLSRFSTFGGEAHSW